MSPSTVPQDRPGRRGSVVALLLVTAFFTTAALAHVWVRLQIVRVGYQLSEETAREGRLLELHRKLEVERSLLRNPARLEREAKARFHLQMPEPEAIFTLRAPPRARSRNAARRRQ